MCSSLRTHSVSICIQQRTAFANAVKPPDLLLPSHLVSSPSYCSLSHLCSFSSPFTRSLLLLLLLLRTSLLRPLLLVTVTAMLDLINDQHKGDRPSPRFSSNQIIYNTVQRHTTHTQCLWCVCVCSMVWRM